MIDTAHIVFDFKADDCSCGSDFNFEIDPDECFNIVVDFEGKLPEGIFLSSVGSIKIIDILEGTDVTTVFTTVVGTIQPNLDGDDLLVNLPICGNEGVLNKNYKIELVVIGDDGLPTKLKICLNFKISKKCE